MTIRKNRRKKVVINRVGDHCFTTLTGTSREIAGQIMAIGNILWTKKPKKTRRTK